VLALQRLVGHTELSITTRYVGFTTDDLKESHDRFGSAMTMLR
jgi:site-specific recombinase XerD